MTLHDYSHLYDSDYNHSAILKEIFGIFNYQGVDYINKHGIKIEFKESLIFDEQINRVRFAVYQKDRDGSDYIVFLHINQNGKMYCLLHKSKQILKKYKFNNQKHVCQPYLSTIRKNPIKSFFCKYKSLKDIFNKLRELKDFIDKIQKFK